MIEKGIIVPSSSAFASPIVMVSKPNGKWRFCVDFRNLGFGDKVKAIRDLPIPKTQKALRRFLGIKYDTREKEAMAIMFGLKKFRPYYYPNHVTVMTDHGNLRWLMAHQQKGHLAR
eukprot:NODE_149_length_15530_cov_0.274448.p6 type:complete len:116 gc:universal NODE_149_length_15530_cov_0.274448:10192-10539(+)